MVSRILLYFGLLVIGWVLSRKGYIQSKLMCKISNLQSLILFILIFIMGIRVGMDDQVISSIGQIGIKAVVFAVITAGFSVVFVFITRKKLITDKSIVGGKND